MIKDITPQVWKYFEDICQIPRPSKKEEKIRAYIKRFAQENHLPFKEDDAGNILISKPATSGKEHLKTAVLQSHVDMVCEKNQGVKHNFNTDPIDFYIDGDWMKARGTTLGADDGIGVAAMLAILAEPTIEHGPLEAFFTVDEETGLTGATALQKDFLTGDILINLDSEDEGELFIGCAGGIDTVATFTYTQDEVPLNSVAYRLSISGMLGGHSGEDIDKRRGNAIKVLNHFLLDASGLFGVSLHTIDGGNLRNAIPREASAVVVVNKSSAKSFETHCSGETQLWKEALLLSAPDIQITLEPCELPSFVIDIVTQSCLMHTIATCPSGVVSLSETMLGLVSTSTNLASVKCVGKNKIVVATSQRSDNENEKAKLAKRIRNIFEMSEAVVKTSDGYPGWTPNPHSQILEIAQASYLDLFHKEPKVKAIHAGLECGLFLEKYPHLDMISIGPTVKNVHSPSEQLNIPTVKLFIELLLDMLKRIPSK